MSPRRLHGPTPRQLGRRDLEDDELIEELAGFLHVAAHSDAFGFDMLGWITHPGADEHEAMLVEVKSSVDGTFHLSPNEWRCAEDFASDYCVLVVRRAATSAVPQSLDLLVDPVRLVADAQLSRTPDGYLLGYVARRNSDGVSPASHVAV